MSMPMPRPKPAGPAEPAGTAGLGPGCDQRNPREIQAELVRQGLNQSTLAEHLGISQSLVSRTVHGIIHNRRVLQALVDLGIPARFLNLPADMQPNREAA